MDRVLIYKNNLLAIKHTNPKLYKRLELIQSNNRYEVFVNENDPIDINIFDNVKKISLYKKPIQDTLLKIEEFTKYSRYPFMVFFGFGNGVFMKSLLQNEHLTNLIVIEPEIEILYIALHFLDFSEELTKNMLTLIHLEDFDYYTIRTMIGQSTFAAYLRTYNLHLTLSYYGSYQKESLKVNSIITDAILHFVHTHGNCTKDSLIGVEHFVANIPRMLKNNTFTSLRKGKNSDIVVMVSTGPSLNKQLPLLREIQENVTIISIDASLPVLERNGIKPDIVCSMERVKDSAKFFENTSKDMYDDLIVISSALQHQAVYDNIKGGELCVVMRPFEYMKYFELNDFGYAGIGLSAANLGLEVAYLMNYDKLIMIGQDLAYGDDGTSHATGHVFGVNEREFEETDSFVLGWGGQKMVRTNNTWRLFLNYFITDIEDAKSKLSVINCTEGGARIDGTIEMGFAEAVSSLVDRSYKKSKIILAKTPNEIYKLNIRRAKEKLEEILKYTKDLKKQIEEVFLDIAKECENLDELNKNKQLDKIDFEHLKQLLDKIDHIKELCVEEKFRRLLWDSVQSFFLSMEMENGVIAVRPATNDEEVKAKQIEFLFSHKPFFFLLAGGIDAFITVIERAKTELYEEAKKA
jgi:hypothetical protein